jgi:hypothetical protein
MNKKSFFTKENYYKLKQKIYKKNKKQNQQQNNFLVDFFK